MWSPRFLKSSMIDRPSRFGEHPVGDDHVVAALGRHCRATLAVPAMLGDVARFPKRLAEIGGGLVVVLDDQDAHFWRATEFGSCQHCQIGVPE